MWQRNYPSANSIGSRFKLGLLKQIKHFSFTKLNWSWICGKEGFMPGYPIQVRDIEFAGMFIFEESNIAGGIQIEGLSLTEKCAGLLGLDGNIIEFLQFIYIYIYMKYQFVPFRPNYQFNII